LKSYLCEGPSTTNYLYRCSSFNDKEIKYELNGVPQGELSCGTGTSCTGGSKTYTSLQTETKVIADLCRSSGCATGTILCSDGTCKVKCSDDGTITDTFCSTQETCQSRGECIANDDNTECVSECMPFLQQWDRKNQECGVNYMAIGAFIGIIILLKIGGRKQ